MYNKTELYNLALNTLLLSKRIANSETDDSTEKRIFETQYYTALYSTLEDLDLTRTSQQVTLELIEEEPNDHWKYVYKYPNRAAFIRRIVSPVLKDNEDTRIKMKVAVYEGQLAIFTNEYQADAEIIDKEISLSILSSNAFQCVAHKLALLSAPLLVGKNTNDLKKSIMEMYTYFKLEAQRQDYMENFSYETPEEQSTFVRARME